MFARKRALQPTRAVVNRFERETITAEALGEKPTQLNVIFDDKKSLHFQHQLADTSASQRSLLLPLQNFMLLNQSLSHWRRCDGRMRL